MSEQANFGTPDEGPEIVWRDSQGNGLTREEAEDLAYQFRYYHAEREIEHTENYWKFLRWCVDNGRLVEGDPDGTAVMRKRKVMSPLPHLEWRFYMDGDFDLGTPPDDSPPAA